jgi:CheY-like chemotaxis protein
MSIEHKASILVVDDSEIVREILGLVLGAAGFRVRALASAFQMSAAIHEEKPDLILLDVMMPALNGDRAASILQQHQFSREIPVLFFSDAAEAELKELVRRSGVFGYLKKTPGCRGVPEAIERWLEAWRSIDQVATA